MADDPKKNDFSDVVGGSSSTAPSPQGKPGGGSGGFSDVVGGSSSTAPSPGGAAGGGRAYVVQSGDSLSKISKKFYGNPNEWKRIFEANKDRIKNPDLIQPGWTLKIPE